MRCGYCNQEGHNQRTCSVKTAALKRRHDREVADGRTNSYWIRQYQQRIAPKGSKGKKVSSQQCGYCQEYGHTRRKCSTLENDKAFYAKHHNMIVDVCRDYILRSPVGIGSLFKSTREEWDGSKYIPKTRMFIVTGFTLSDDLWTCEPNPIIVMKQITTGEIARKHLRGFVRGEKDINYYSKFQLVNTEAQDVPSGWADEHRTNVAKLAKHTYFVRSGNKHEDVRNYSIQSLLENRERASNPDSWGHQSAKETVAKWSEPAIRERLFKDFEKDV